MQQRVKCLMIYTSTKSVAYNIFSTRCALKRESKYVFESKKMDQMPIKAHRCSDEATMLICLCCTLNCAFLLETWFGNMSLSHSIDISHFPEKWDYYIWHLTRHDWGWPIYACKYGFCPKWRIWACPSFLIWHSQWRWITCWKTNLPLPAYHVAKPGMEWDNFCRDRMTTTGLTYVLCDKKLTYIYISTENTAEWKLFSLYLDHIY